MTGPLDQLKVDPLCEVETCLKQDCEVNLDGVPHPFRVIDMDDSPPLAKGARSPSPAKGARCDYLFVGAVDANASALHVVPLELKSSGFNAVRVSKQLERGAIVAAKVVPKVAYRFTPVVAHDGAHRRQIMKLRKLRVSFRGKEYLIKVMKCGTRLVEVLGKV